MNGAKAEYRQKLPQFHRSDIAPVGIVMPVSMKTDMKKNSASVPTSWNPLVRKKPPVPNNPNLKVPSPCAPIPHPWDNTDKPGPREGYQPGAAGPLNQFPQPKANP